METRVAKIILAVALFAFLFSVTAAQAQRARGEVRITVRDPQGAAVSSAGELVSDSNQFRRTFQVSDDGRYIAQDLPFGVYRLTLTAPGFASSSSLLEVRSEVPIHFSLTLGIAPLATQVQVNDAATLLDPSRAGMLHSIGRQTLGQDVPAQSGRGLSDAVNDLPGWLYEANGVLHPRGSEYDVQYVIDGLPLTQNRSPAFAPSLDPDAVDSMRVLTANYPAEYGRKLGGIVEVVTEKSVPTGWHELLDLSGGSFTTINGFAAVSYSHGKDRLSLSSDGFLTDRYLDPPVLANYTNHASSAGFTASFTRDFSDRDRLRVSVSHDVVHFIIPNELVQQQAGQRQDAANTESAGQLYFQHVISPDLMLNVSGSVREALATLSSNEQSTPVIVSQNRGYREGYFRGDLAGHHGRHDWKVGGDTILNPVHENLQYTITNPSQFDPGTQQHFQFSDQRWDVEPSAYAQDQIHLGNWGLSAGLRFDHYRFVVHESAWSPRLGISRYFPSLSLVLHASYDRVFQTPAVENLLLASSPQVNSLNSLVLRLPVRPGRGNFYEVGFSKALLGILRVDANVFRRDFRNYSDDDVLLDTGVSFPTAFAKARITGEELRLEVPHWGRFSGYLSYTNQVGTGQGPITGGLFLGSDVVNATTDLGGFPVTQDQRNTARARLHFQASGRVWLAMDGQYGSGLPAEVGDADVKFLLAQYGPAVLNRVDFDRQRVRPNFAMGVAGGVDLYHKEQRSASVQLQVANLTNRVNVINFASLFSGTAIAPPRSVSARLKLTF
jgi:carboxypeptidase family protein